MSEKEGLYYFEVLSFVDIFDFNKFYGNQLVCFHINLIVSILTYVSN